MDPGALSDYLNLSSKTSTFVSIDVVGSTQLKAGENEQDIIYTFLSYHKLVSDTAYECHGEVINITGDGMMCRFQKPDDAAALIETVLGRLPEYNKRHNRLSRPLMLRLGAHTGEVLEPQAVNAGQWISQTIDLAAKLQQGSEPNTARFSEAAVTALQEHGRAYRRIGWDSALSMNIYEHRSQTAAAERKSRRPDPLHVLVVEHELDEILRLKKVLLGRHHEPFSVYSQNQAALCLSGWQAHLVLLSVELPWNTGWELLTSLRSDNGLSNVPIITMSRQTTGDLIQKSFRMGANGFLRKPLDDQQIVKRVETVLREFYP